MKNHEIVNLDYTLKELATQKMPGPMAFKLHYLLEKMKPLVGPIYKTLEDVTLGSPEAIEIENIEQEVDLSISLKESELSQLELTPLQVQRLMPVIEKGEFIPE